MRVLEFIKLFQVEHYVCKNPNRNYHCEEIEEKSFITDGVLIQNGFDFTVCNSQFVIIGETLYTELQLEEVLILEKGNKKMVKKTYGIKLPAGAIIADIFNLPENVEEIIREDFLEYQKCGCLSDEASKLMYVDSLVNEISGRTFEDIVREAVSQKIMLELLSDDEFSSNSIYNLEFLHLICQRGQQSSRLCQEFLEDSSSVNKRYREILVIILTEIFRSEEEISCFGGKTYEDFGNFHDGLI